MLTLGIDLAAKPRNTATCLIDWEGERAFAREIRRAVDDEALLETIATADKVGIDVPLGWPDEFIAAITAHQQRRGWPGREQDQDSYRSRLSFRATDREVIAAGQRPLSVSTDRLGVVAMRAAHLLDRLAAAGEPVDRGGAGKVCEVYPAAALNAWGLGAAGYKSEAGSIRLSQIVRGIEERLPGLRVHGAERRAVETDHNALDALIAALVARAAALLRTRFPNRGEEADRAAREGWIHLPVGPLEELAGPRG